MPLPIGSFQAGVKCVHGCVCVCACERASILSKGQSMVGASPMSLAVGLWTHVRALKVYVRVQAARESFLGRRPRLVVRTSSTPETFSARCFFPLCRPSSPVSCLQSKVRAAKKPQTKVKYCRVGMSLFWVCLFTKESKRKCGDACRILVRGQKSLTSSEPESGDSGTSSASYF